MISLSSVASVLSAVQHARDVSVTAYTLPSGPMLDALTGAARRGARVRVRLEGYVYRDDGSVATVNARTIARLRDAGADAQLVHTAADARDPMLHLKAAVVDGTLFLDDRNWPVDGADTVIRDSRARDARMVLDAAAGKSDTATRFFAVRKREALASEARLLRGAGRGDEVVIESESFGKRNAVYSALEAAAKRGAHMRMLVTARDLAQNPRERAAIDTLERDGVDVRVCDSDEKFAVVSRSGAWIGSANASASFDTPDQLDWGLRTRDRHVIAHLKAAFEQRWNGASPATASYK